MHAQKAWEEKGCLIAGNNSPKLRSVSLHNDTTLASYQEHYWTPGSMGILVIHIDYIVIG